MNAIQAKSRSYLVKDYMGHDIVTVDVGESVLAASKLMDEKGIGYVIVLEKSKPTGIVTERDLVMKVMAKEQDPSTVKASKVMSTPLITVDPNANIETAVSIMAKHRIRRLPVVRENVIYGVFTTRDLTKYFGRYLDRVTRDLIGAQPIFQSSYEMGF